MGRGRSNKLVGQTGEYLVAAALSRRGLIATTFTGNVPHYDIIASERYLRSTPVRLAQALERMEAAAETIVDADAQPHLAGVR